MPVKCVLDGALRSVLLHVQIPHQCLLVRRTDYPVVPHGKGGPLYVCNQPRKSVPKMAREVVRSIEVNNVESVGAGGTLAMLLGTLEGCIRGQSNISAGRGDSCGADFAINVN